MGTLIVEPTEIAQWHALVKDAAERVNHLEINENLESYLVFLLLRFSDHPELASAILALEYLKGVESFHGVDHDQLQEVGDKCLLFAGLFPAQAERRHVNMGYFVNLGKLAYAQAASRNRLEKMQLLEGLSEQFVALMDVLLSMRESAYCMAGLTPLQVQELWSLTQSHWAFENLQQMTHGIPVNPGSKK